MIEIVHQDTVKHEGNDCLIEDCYSVLKCFDEYMVVHCRRHRGQYDNSLRFVEQVKCSSQNAAMHELELMKNR